MTLTHLGDTVILMNSPGSGYWGSSTDNFINTVITDDSSVSIESIPEEGEHNNLDGYAPIETLSKFNTHTLSGEWKLTIEDIYPLEDDGELKLC